MQAIADDEAADFQEGDHGQGQEALGQDVCRRRDDGGCDEGQEDDVFPFLGQHGRRDEIQLGQDDEDQWQVEEDAEGQDQHEDEIQVIHTYEDVFCYDVHTDIALAGRLLHDIMKPFVFQWQPDGSSLKEYTIAGQGAHHVISIAESMYHSQGAKFNYFKNYIESQLSCMYLNMLQAEPDGERLVAQAVAKVIVK